MLASCAATANESPWSRVLHHCDSLTSDDVGRNPFIITGLDGSQSRTAASSDSTKSRPKRHECSNPSGSTASCSSCHATTASRLRYLVTTWDMKRLAADSNLV